MQKRFFSAFFSLVLLMLAICPVAAMANAATMYMVSSNGLGVHMRTQTDASVRNNIICTIPYGDTVDVLSYTDGGKWAHIQYGSTSGYIMSRYLSVDKPQAVPVQSNTNNNNKNNNTTEVELPDFSKFQKVEPYNVIVRPSKPNGFVNFRWAPSMQCKVAMRCYADYPLQVIAQDSHWVQVMDPQTGYVGFMYRHFVTPVATDAQIGQGVVINQ